MEKHLYEVYWETKTAKGVRRYSRIFKHEILAVPFFAEKRRKETTTMAFCREVAVSYDDRGRATEIRFVNLLCAHLVTDTAMVMGR